MGKISRSLKFALGIPYRVAGPKKKMTYSKSRKPRQRRLPDPWAPTGESC